MKNRVTRFLPILLLALPPLILSCQRDIELDDRPFSLSAPVAKTQLSLSNFIAEDNYKLESDSSISLVFSEKLYSTSALEFFTIPEKEESNSVSLETISLSNTALTTGVILGDAYPPAKILDGQEVEIPSLDIDNAVSVPVDAGTFFQSAQLESGWMYVSINNGFPVDIQYMNFVLKNRSDGSTVAEMEFRNIKAGETAVDSADMTGVYAEGLMQGDLIKVITEPSNGKVRINKNDELKMTVRVQDLKAFSATAIFPAQDLIDFNRNWRYDFGDAQVKFLKIKSGQLKLWVESNVDEKIFVTYEAPGLTLDGDTVMEQFEVPAASSGTPYSETKTIDLVGYEVNLRGKKSEGWNEFNAFHHRMYARIDSTGEMKSISKNDSVIVYVGLLDLVPEYAEGYLGRSYYYTGKDSSIIDAFGNMSGQLDLKSLDFQLRLENSAGLDADIQIQHLNALNRDGSSIPLEGYFMNSGIYIEQAPDSSSSVNTVLNLDEQNSNITTFMGSMPHVLEYAVGFQLNPDGHNNNFGDFISSNDEIGAYIDFELPLNMKTNNLQLRDTSEFEASIIENRREIESATLHLIADNGFPLGMDLDIILLDENNLALDTLFSEGDAEVAPGLMKDFSGKVSESKRSIVSSDLDEKAVSALRETRKVVFITHFDTRRAGHTRLYHDYQLNIGLSARINYVQ